MKRVTLFVASMGAGGAQRVISIMSKYLADRGYEVSLVTFYDRKPAYDIDSRVSQYCLEKEINGNQILKKYRWFRSFIRNHCDVLVSFLAVYNMFAILAGLHTHKKIIVADRNDPRFVPENRLMRFARDYFYKFADKIVVQTTDNRLYFSKKIQNKSKVIFNPVDLGEKQKLALRTDKANRIVSAGRLTAQKNQLMLVQAFQEFSEEFPDYTLTIYGEGPDRQKLELYVKDNELSENVFFPGNINNLFEEISNAKLFILSSNYEGMPNALIEAMCLGLPCISTRVSGASDIIDDGKNGKLVDVGDMQHLAIAMKEIIRYAELQRVYGQNAISLNDDLKADSIMEQWMCLFDE